jgi:hypothetical protein
VVVVVVVIVIFVFQKGNIFKRAALSRSKAFGDA